MATARAHLRAVRKDLRAWSSTNQRSNLIQRCQLRCVQYCKNAACMWYAAYTRDSWFILVLTLKKSKVRIVLISASQASLIVHRAYLPDANDGREFYFKDVYIPSTKVGRVYFTLQDENDKRLRRQCGECVLLRACLQRGGENGSPGWNLRYRDAQFRACQMKCSKMCWCQRFFTTPESWCGADRQHARASASPPRGEIGNPNQLQRTAP